jgi:uncharacterized protein YkwD
MLARHFFDHRTPEGLGPRERIGRQRVRFELCSENIYSITDGPSDPAELASVVVGGWMATAGHRRNILDPDFHYAGVGAAAAGRAVMVTQLFGG